jgi:hypothetical protein
MYILSFSIVCSVYYKINMYGIRDPPVMGQSPIMGQGALPLETIISTKLSTSWKISNFLFFFSEKFQNSRISGFYGRAPWPIVEYWSITGSLTTVWFCKKIVLVWIAPSITNQILHMMLVNIKFISVTKVRSKIWP